MGVDLFQPPSSTASPARDDHMDVPRAMMS
jgi:hypothetical protein